MKEIIYITVERGMVQDVNNVPPGIEVQVIDKDVDLRESDRLSISPVDGDACTIAVYESS